MAISIPIIAEWQGGGALKKARQEFAQLEGAGKKAAFAIRKAAIPAAAALTGIGAALFDATKGAIEDAAAQDQLAKSLNKTTGATDQQIASVEAWISEQGRLLGITDSEIRPAFAKLARATGSVTKAQELAAQAFDISAATGKPLATVVQALERAYGGNLMALAKLAPEYRNLIKDGASFEQVMDKIAKTTSGAASAAAETTAGKFKRLQVSMDETKESIGAALVPVIEKALPVLEKFATWAGENPELFLMIAAAITAVSVAIMAVNVAMALNPFSLIAAGIALLVVALGTAYVKFEGFRKVVNKVVNMVLGYFEFMINGWITLINTIIRGYNKIPGLPDIGTIGPVTLPRIRSGGPDTEGLSATRVTALASGGIVMSPTLAMVGEGGEPEAVIPLSKLAAMGYGGNGVNITVQTGVGDPVAIGREVAKVMDAYSRRSGRAA